MHAPLVADGGEITVGRQMATRVYGAWQVKGPDDALGEDKDKRTEWGYIYRPDDAPQGRFDIAYVRADASMDMELGTSNCEQVMDTATRRVQGDAFFERDITASGLGRLTPGKDFRVGDVVPVLLWGKVMRLPVTAIDWVSTREEPAGWRVHVGGQMISDAQGLRQANDKLQQQIDADRRRTLKELGAVDKKASTAVETSSRVASGLEELQGKVDAIQAADGSTNFYGVDEPSAPVAGDTWFKPGPDGSTTIWVFDGSTWVEAVPTLDLTEVDNAIAALQAAQANAAEDLAAAREKVATAQQEIANAVADVAALSDRVAKVPTTGEIDSKLSQLVTYNKFNESMTALDGDLARLRTRMDSAHSSLATLDSNLETLQGQLGNTNRDLSGLDSKMADLSATMGGLHSTIDSLNSDFELVRATALQAGLLMPGNLVWNPQAKNNMQGWKVNAPLSGQFFPAGGVTAEFVRVSWTDAPVVRYVDFGAPDSTTYFPIAPGQEFMCRVWVRSSVDLPADALRLYVYPSGAVSSPPIPAGTWTKIEGVVKVTPRTPMPTRGWFRIYFKETVPQDALVDLCDPWCNEAAGQYLIVDGAVVADKLAANAVTAGKIAAGAVTAGKIAANAVTANEIAAGAITATKIGANQVTTKALAAGAVTANELAADAVVAGKIAANTVTGNEIAANSITTRELTITPGSLFPDGNFRDPCWGDSGQVFRSPNNNGELKFVANGTQQGRYFRPQGAEPDQALALEPGAAYRLATTVWTTAGINLISIYMRYIKVGASAASVLLLGNLSPLPDGTTRQSLDFTAPTDMKDGSCTLGFFIQSASKSGTATIWNTQLVRAADAGLIVDGGILARHITAGEITGDKLAANTITADKIGTNQIVARNIATNAVTAGKIAANAVTAAAIKAGEVTSDKLTIANGFITNAMIADLAVTEAKIANLAVSTAKIRNASISTAKIQDAAITNAKIGSLDAGKITSGFLDAARIKAGTIRADQVVASAFTTVGTSVLPLIPGTTDPAWTAQATSGPLGPVTVGGETFTYYSWSRTAAPVHNHMVAVDPTIDYDFSVWVSGTNGSVLYVELRDQNGAHAVESGAITQTDPASPARGSSYLIRGLTIQSGWKKYSSTVRLKPQVRAIKVGAIYGAHPNGVTPATASIGDMQLRVHVPDQAQIDAAQNTAIQANAAAIAANSRADEAQQQSANDLYVAVLALDQKLRDMEIRNTSQPQVSLLSTAASFDDWWAFTPGRSAAIVAKGNWTGQAQVYFLSRVSGSSAKFSAIPGDGGTRTIRADVGDFDGCIIHFKVSPGAQKTWTYEQPPGTQPVSSAWKTMATWTVPADSRGHQGIFTAQIQKPAGTTTVGVRIVAGEKVLAEDTRRTYDLFGVWANRAAQLGWTDLTPGTSVDFQVLNSSASKSDGVRGGKAQITYLQQ